MMAGMPEVLILLLAACGTALATGLGAIPDVGAQRPRSECEWL